MKRLEVDCLIIGTGMAGAVAASEIARRLPKASIVLVTRTERPEETATVYAQGGIIYLGNGDDDKGLARDIIAAGAGICNPLAVEKLSCEGPGLVKELLLDRLKIAFDQSAEGAFDLVQEAAHSIPRILHAGDQTGKILEIALLNNLKSYNNIQLLTAHTAVDLLTLAHHSLRPVDLYQPPRCIGAYVFDQKSRQVTAILARETILATGGLGQLYLNTTNPLGARGDGLAMAYRTGARIMNLEYIQFHPTALYTRGSDRFLITEAMRGEGARLYNHARKEFMPNYDSRGALAPRDIVARAMAHEMLREDSQWLYLDISHRPADWIRGRFPAIYAECLKHSIDITHQPIPVVPAAHYSCGGVAVDLQGRTSIRNLWAVGEVSCTGVHGANRLASTSLLENLVWGVSAGRGVASDVAESRYEFPPIREWIDEKEPIDIGLLAQDWLTIKHTMWNYVGLIRTSRRLDRANRILGGLAEEVGKFYAHSELTDELLGLRNASQAAQLVLTAARRNHTSTGCHFLAPE